MSKNHSCGLDELFDLFEDSLSPADVLASKLMAQISTAITKERIKLRMNQHDFAEHIEATQSLISRWEHGDYNFSIKKLAEIAVKLDLDVNISISNRNACKSVGEYDSTGMYPQSYTVIYSENSKDKTLNSTYSSKINSKSISSLCK